MLGNTGVFQLLGLLDRLLETAQVLDAMTAEDLHGVHAPGLGHAQAHVLHLECGLHALAEAVHEVQGHTELQLVDAALLEQVVPEHLGELGRGVGLRYQAQALRVVGQAVHDVGDRQLARAAHDAVVAGGAHPHGIGLQNRIALAGADHHEDLLRGVLPVLAKWAGAGADAALHAHLDPFAFFNVGLDFLEEAAAILVDHRLIQIAH